MLRALAVEARERRSDRVLGLSFLPAPLCGVAALGPLSSALLWRLLFFVFPPIRVPHRPLARLSTLSAV